MYITLPPHHLALPSTEPVFTPSWFADARPSVLTINGTVFGSDLSLLLGLGFPAVTQLVVHGYVETVFDLSALHNLTSLTVLDIHDNNLLGVTAGPGCDSFVDVAATEEAAAVSVS